MKKKLTYPLLVAVLFIWGWIFYKVLSASGDQYTPTSETIAKPSLSPKPEPDEASSYEINGKYRDPFLADEHTVVAKEEELAGGMIQENMPQVEELYVDWSQIKYVGEVNGKAAKKQVVIVNINGRDRMMKVGETSDGVTLLQHTSVYIKVRYQGKQHTIQKKETTG